MRIPVDVLKTAVCVIECPDFFITLHQDRQSYLYARFDGGDRHFYPGESQESFSAPTAAVVRNVIATGTLSGSLKFKTSAKTVKQKEAVKSDDLLAASFALKFVATQQFYKPSPPPLRVVWSAELGYEPSHNDAYTLSLFSGLRHLWDKTKDGLWMLKHLKKCFGEDLDSYNHKRLCSVILKAYSVVGNVHSQFNDDDLAAITRWQDGTIKHSKVDVNIRFRLSEASLSGYMQNTATDAGYLAAHGQQRAVRQALVELWNRQIAHLVRDEFPEPARFHS